MKPFKIYDKIMLLETSHNPCVIKANNPRIFMKITRGTEAGYAVNVKLI